VGHKGRVIVCGQRRVFPNANADRLARDDPRSDYDMAVLELVGRMKLLITRGPDIEVLVTPEKICGHAARHNSTLFG